MTATPALFDRVQAAASLVRGSAALQPEVAIILGTGLGGLTERLELEVAIPYTELPGFAVPTIALRLAPSR